MRTTLCIFLIDLHSGELFSSYFCSDISIGYTAVTLQ